MLRDRRLQRDPLACWEPGFGRLSRVDTVCCQKDAFKRRAVSSAEAIECGASGET